MITAASLRDCTPRNHRFDLGPTPTTRVPASTRILNLLDANTRSSRHGLLRTLHLHAPNLVLPLHFQRLVHLQLERHLDLRLISALRADRRGLGTGDRRENRGAIFIERALDELEELRRADVRRATAERLWERPT